MRPLLPRAVPLRSLKPCLPQGRLAANFRTTHIQLPVHTGSWIIELHVLREPQPAKYTASVQPCFGDGDTKGQALQGAYAHDILCREGILEYYWGEHIHLGHYSAAERAAGYKKKDFKRAKIDFVDEMLRWSGAQAPARVLDVGCGIGGTSRHLAARFPDAQVQGAPSACAACAPGELQGMSGAELASGSAGSGWQRLFPSYIGSGPCMKGHASSHADMGRPDVRGRHYAIIKAGGARAAAGGRARPGQRGLPRDECAGHGVPG